MAWGQPIRRLIDAAAARSITLGTEHPPTPLRRFLRYVRPDSALIVGATRCGSLKFTLPAAFAIALRFMTDRLVPQFAAASATTDSVFRPTEGYLHWVAAQLPAAWNAQSAWRQFNILATTLLGAYSVWGVVMYYRSYWTQLAGHRVMLDLRTDLFQHIQRLSHAALGRRPWFS